MSMDFALSEALSKTTQTPTASISIDLAIVLSAWIVGILIVNPIGEFPLDSDWSYARSVENLLETGDFRPLGWAAMTLVTNIYWGALFCLPAGFSFIALRFSSLAASLLALFGLIVMMRDMNQPRSIRILVALTVGFCPLFYSVSFSFQTDTLFAALSIWAVVFLSLGHARGSILLESIGILLCVLATLSRQIALCIPLAYLAIRIFENRVDRASLTMRDFTPIAVSSLAYVIFTTWLKTSGRSPTYFTYHQNFLAAMLSDLGRFLEHFSRNVFSALLYAGLFLLPLTMTALWHLSNSDRRRAVQLLALGGTVTLLSSALYSTGKSKLLMPTLWPNLTESGIGPVLLHDIRILHSDNLPAFPYIFWLAVTFASIVGMAFLIATVANIVRPAPQRRTLNHSAALLLTSAGIYLIVTSCVSVHDRWFIPLIAFLAAAIPISTDALRTTTIRYSKIPAATCLILLAVFSIGTTRDYMEWNRVRWDALNALMRDQRISPTQIDGGLEFNAWYLYEDVRDVHKPDWDRAGEKSWWWVHDDEYLISFGPVDGYRTFKEYSYTNWLPPHRQTVNVLKKE